MRQVTIAASAGVLTLLAAFTSPAAPAKRILTPEDMVQIERVGDPQIAPQGDRVAFVVTALDRARKPRSRIWVAPLADGLPREVDTPGAAWAPRWSPDRTALAFIGIGLGEGAQIGLWSPADGRVEALSAEKGTIRDLQWSPDGSSMAFIQVDPEGEAERERRVAGDDAVVVDQSLRHARLFLLNPKSRQTRLLTPGHKSVWKFSFAPDGRRIALLWSDLPSAEGQEYGCQLALLNLADGTTTVLVPRVNVHATPVFSPDGNTIAYLGPVGEFKERGTVHVHSLLTHETTMRLADAPYTVWDLRWHPDGSLLAATARGAVNRVIRVDSAGVIDTCFEMNHSMTPYWSPVWTVSADGKTAAFISESPDHPEEVFVAHLDGTGRKRSSFSNSALAEVALGKVEAIEWKRGPETLEGILVWPPNAVAGKRLPTVTLLHGGPGYNWGIGVQIQQWAQLFAAEGYLVFLPNFRGSTGYGFAWMSANVRDWGEGPMNDVLSGVDHLVAKGWADPARLLLGGRSYGGYLTAWMVTHTDRFKAAYDMAGLSDLATAFGTTDEPSFFQGYFRATPYQDGDIYRAHSPLTFASRARTPTLILHGEKDLRCPVFQAQVFYAALKHHGVATELLIYPREGHGFSEYPHQIDAMRRVLAWFRKHDPREP